jgi:predicted SnoaL-like aldol condensation-catalyzing enzyme
MSPFRMERIESATRVVIAFVEAYNGQDIAAMMRLVSEDSVLESPTPAPNGMILSGKATLTQYWSDFFQQYPQAHLKVEESLGYGMRCILRWRREWVDTTGKNLHLRGTDLFRVQNGLISEEFTYIKG